MSDIFKNVNFEDVDLERYKSIDMSFSREEKEGLKKKLRKKIAKNKSKRNGLVASAAMILIALFLVSNENSVLANVIPTFDKLYASLGFKSEYLPQSAYIGKTYEENGIKVTLENLVGTKHVIKVALKIEYSDKWSKEDRPLVHFGCGFEGKIDTGSTGGLKDINDNTELRVIDFTSEKEFLSKGNFEIKAFSDGFKNPVTWDMKVDFSKDFNETIEKSVTMPSDIGVAIKSIEANSVGTIITSNSVSSKGDDLWLSNMQYFLKIDNKIYPILGAAWGNKEENYTFLENVSYDTIKTSKNISLIKHNNERLEKAAELQKKSKEESIREGNEIKEQLDDLPKGEIDGVTYTKEITFNNGKKASIYDIERTDNGKLRVYVKGDDKKQIFNMLLNLYTTGSGSLVQAIEETDTGYIAEFDDIPKEKVTIKMATSILDCSGDYNEEESMITLK